MRRIGFLLLLILEFSVYAQQTVVGEVGDEVVLTPDSYDGTILWQVSEDNNVFSTENGNQNGSFVYVIDFLPVYIRAEINRNRRGDGFRTFLWI